MLLLFNLTKQTFTVALLVFCCVNQFKAQTQSSLTVEQAKIKLEQLQSEYIEIDEMFNERIETEVAKQVSIAPKGEFESTQQYNARLTRADTLKKKLQAQYQSAKRNRQNELRRQINNFLDLVFARPITVNLGTYDADEEKFPVTVIDETNDKTYEDSFYIPRNEARVLKENFSESQKQGLFGVALNDGQPVEYYYGFKINFKGKQYTSLPPELALTPKEFAQYYGVYTDPYVIQIRKTLNTYLKNPKALGELELELLSQVDADYFQSKFIVYSIDPFIAGGKLITIIFQDRPDAIFKIWIYRTLEMRIFEQQETDARLMRLVRLRFKRFLQDKVHSL